ncbi:hypothetical protein [Brucella intermedia]|uniref:hypothetical protein n=1 Tax=Brucella intermedia TaxID=94625 RepID=UPI00224B8ADC|nr:hypothetical protein [Brucella intermedia]
MTSYTKRHLTEAEHDVFNAALNGLISSPAFHGGLYQQSPAAAVKFALECVEEYRKKCTEEVEYDELPF